MQDMRRSERTNGDLIFYKLRIWFHNYMILLLLFSTDNASSTEILLDLGIEGCLQFWYGSFKL